ncbi:unnamed protein product [Prunus brigantina]
MEITPKSSSSALRRLCRKLSPRKTEAGHHEVRGPIENPTTCSSISSNSDLQMSKMFDFFDENGDGKISPAELQTCVRSVGGELSEEEAEAAVEASDLDGDGLLGFEEFQKLMEATNDDNKNQQLRDAFGMYEMEGSGCITPASLKRMLSRLGDSRSIDDCKAMIRPFDLNGDGVLSFNEFTIMMR